MHSPELAQLRQLRLPVHTVGFGPDHFNKDIEVEEAAIPARALPTSRLVARVTLRQNGYGGEKVSLTVRENGHPLAQRTITLKDAEQSETIMFNSGVAGAHSFQIGVDPAPGEENKSNNALVRLVNVTPKKMRILYMEGEPRWEYKFIRRAVEDDQSIDLTSVVRTNRTKPTSRADSPTNWWMDSRPLRKAWTSSMAWLSAASKPTTSRRTSSGKFAISPISAAAEFFFWLAGLP